MNDPSIRYGQCDDTCTVDCGHCKGEGPPDVSSVRAVDLDLDQIEARANAATEAFNARTANDREWCHSAAVTALDGERND